MMSNGLSMMPASSAIAGAAGRVARARTRVQPQTRHLGRGQSRLLRLRRGAKVGQRHARVALVPHDEDAGERLLALVHGGCTGVQRQALRMRRMFASAVAVVAGVLWLGFDVDPTAVGIIATVIGGVGLLISVFRR